MSELKPCPFCGSDYGIVLGRIDNLESFAVVCTKCFASTCRCNNDRKAIEAWNRRAEDGKDDSISNL